MNKLIIILGCLLAIGSVFGQESNEVAKRNQEKIDELKNRISNIEGATDASACLELQGELSKFQDSVQVLNALIKEMKQPVTKKGAVKILDGNADLVVFFEHDISAKDYSILDDLQSLLTTYFEDQSKTIKIVGHADRSGNKSYNTKLSKQRAVSLKQYLVEEKKIPEAKIQVEWEGSNKVSDDTPENRHLYRRVEVSLL
jgi:outer membrane protein OmpA-like peptidoglycan-associated protein